MCFHAMLIVQALAVPFDTFPLTGILHGFCSWFEVRFGGIPETQSTYTLSTSPYKPYACLVLFIYVCVFVYCF